MNVPFLNDARPPQQSRDLTDEKMVQVRELLVGDLARASEARMAALEARMKDLETALGHRLDALQARIEALAASSSADRRTAFDELAKSVVALADRIHHISRE